MDQLAIGNQLFVEEDYTGAAKAYSKALAKLMGQDQFGALLGRAKCRIETGNIKLAIGDLTQCISLSPKNGLCNYYLGYYLMKQRSNDYDTMSKCVKYLTIAKENRKEDPRIENALNRATTKLSKLPKPESDKSKNSNVANGTTVSDTMGAAADTQNTDNDVSVGSVESKEKDKDKEEKDKDKTKEEKEKDKDKDDTDKEKTEEKKKKTFRDTWYQNPTTVTYTLYIKNLTKNDVSITFTPSSMEYSIELPNNEGIYRNKLILFDAVIPDKCKYTVNKYKINCVLTKAKAGTEWNDLINPDSIVSNKDSKEDKNKNGISAPWTTNKNWDKVDEFAAEELDKDKPEGDEALQSLFQKIYADGSDEQKRAMVKSFQTSGGTVLSTNWDDVKNKDYEGKDKVLPTGQDVKKWEY